MYWCHHNIPISQFFHWRPQKHHWTPKDEQTELPACEPAPTWTSLITSVLFRIKFTFLMTRRHFAKAIREHTNGFYRMQMQPLRTPHHVSQGWMPAGRHDVPKGAAWGGNLLWKSHYRALSRRGRKPPLIAAAHPAPAGRKLLGSWWERDLLWQPDSRVKPPRC